MFHAYAGLDVRFICLWLGDLPVVSPDALILLKSKAWLDLNERRNNGETIKGDDIKKHRNDVFRLAHILAVGESVAIPKCIYISVEFFE